MENREEAGRAPPEMDPGPAALALSGRSGGGIAREMEMEVAVGNPFVHVELNTTDVAKAKDFYGKLFDWKLQDEDVGDLKYTMVGVGEGTGGGMMKQMIPGAPSAWMPYVDVDDIQAATKKAQSLGAKIMRDVTPVADMGWLSILSDPTGAVIGLWQTNPKSMR